MFVLPADMIYEEGFQDRCFNDVDLHSIWVNKPLFVCFRLHDCHSNFLGQSGFFINYFYSVYMKTIVSLEKVQESFTTFLRVK